METGISPIGYNELKNKSRMPSYLIYLLTSQNKESGTGTQKSCQVFKKK